MTDWKAPDWMIADLQSFEYEENEEDIEYIEHIPYTEACKGRIWITNGSDTRMIYPDDVMPPGWYKGRPNPIKDMDKFRQDALDNNNNAKTYKITYKDGTYEIANQLSKWCRDNNLYYRTIKGIINRGKMGRRRYNKPNSPHNHIESIELLVN